MTAPVRIDAEAWSDLRFATLARILGLADSDHALIKVARIWSWQTEHYTPDAPTYVVDQDTIDSALGNGGAHAMVRARLAEETPEGFRIRGATGRIEWLWKCRRSSKIGGETTRDKWAPQSGRAASQVAGRAALEREGDNNGRPAGIGSGSALGSVPASRTPGPLTPDLPPDQKSLSLAPRAIDSPTYAIARDTWTEVSAARVRIASELGLENVLTLPDRFGMPSEPRGCRELRDRVREEGDNAATACLHVVANLIAQAREERTVEWLSEKAFTAGGWQTARNWIPGQERPRRGPAPRSVNAIGAASPRSDHPDEPGLKSFTEFK